MFYKKKELEARISERNDEVKKLEHEIDEFTISIERFLRESGFYQDHTASYYGGPYRYREMLDRWSKEYEDKRLAKQERDKIEKVVNDILTERGH